MKEDVFNDSIEKILIGEWYDLNSCSATMLTDTGLVEVIVEDISFTFHSDYSYEVDNEPVCLDILNPGKWELENANHIIIFKEVIFSDSIELTNLPEISHTWEILSFTNQLLEVNHVTSIEESVNSDKILIERNRTFEKNN